MVGVSLEKQGITTEPWPEYYSVKESVFPFQRFAGVDIILGPEMRSTGEVMGIDERFSLAFAKSQLAAGSQLPREPCKVFVSVAAPHKQAIIGPARVLYRRGFQLVGTAGTAAVLREAGIEVETVRKIQEGRPNLLDFLANGDIHLILNTPNGKGARTDEGRIRAAAVAHGIPCITTLSGCQAVARAMEALAEDPKPHVRALQDWAVVPTPSSTSNPVLRAGENSWHISFQKNRLTCCHHAAPMKPGLTGCEIGGRSNPSC